MKTFHLFVIGFISVFTAFLFNSIVCADDLSPYYKFSGVKAPDSPYKNTWGAYQTDLYSGSFSYEYKFQLPPGTNGLAPKLSLRYNSHAAKGKAEWVGAGWELPSNHIQRNIQYTRKDTSDDTFELYLDGAKHDLVYVASENRYHTKVESYLKIEKKTDIGAPNELKEYWVVTTPNGTEYRFGYNPDSENMVQKSDSSMAGYVWRWSLDRIKDSNGNCIYYSYSENPTSNDSGAVYLSTIRYGDDWERWIYFHLEDTDKPDMYLTIDQGSEVREARRLGEIGVVVRSSLLRKYKFDYTTNETQPPKSLLASITDSGWDPSAGGRFLSLPPVRFEYKSQTRAFGPEQPWPTPGEKWIRQVDDDSDVVTDTFDVNGDGLPDLVNYDDNHKDYWYVWLNTGNGFSPDVTLRVVGPPSPDGGWDIRDVETYKSGQAPNTRSAATDINGDGYVDFLWADGGAHTNALLVRRGGERAFADDPAVVSWALPTPAWIQQVQLPDNKAANVLQTFFDMNGDGLPDIVKKEGRAWHIWRNTGNSFVDYGVWPVPHSSGFIEDFTRGVANLEIGHFDMNGDGLPDIVDSAGGDWKIYLNTGSDFIEAGTWHTEYSGLITDLDSTGNVKRDLIDINGDGLPDIVNPPKASSTWEVQFNTGKGFTDKKSWQAPSQVPPDGFIRDITRDGNVQRDVFDIDGDGLVDIVRKTASDWKVYSNMAGPVDLLSKITDTLGGTVSVYYTPSMKYENTRLPFNYWVVSSVTTNNGMAGPHAVTATTNYSYAKGLYDFPTREFRGFGDVTETRADTSAEVRDGSKIVHYFHQDEVKKGKEYKTDTFDSANALYTSVANTFSEATSKGLFISNLTRTEEATHDGTITDPKKKAREFQNYDAYGNVRTEINHGDVDVAGDETYEYREFALPCFDQPWVVNRVRHRRILADAEEKAGTKLRESWYEYDGWVGCAAKGNLTKETAWLNGGSNPVTTYGYDGYGNRTSRTDANGHTSRTEFDNVFHTCPVDSWNALGHHTSRLCDWLTGQPTQVVDPNKYVTHYSYDAFGRKVKEIRPYDTDALPTTSIQYLIDGTPPETIIVSKRETSGAVSTFDTVQSIDGFGRLVQTKSPNENLPYRIVVDSYYDQMGRLSRQSNPYVIADSSVGYSVPVATHSTEYSYDALGQPVHIKNPDKTEISRVFDHRTVTETDENGHTKGYVFDAAQRLKSVEEKNQGNSYLTTYNYSPLGELLEIRDSQGTGTSYDYDSLGRKTGMADMLEDHTRARAWYYAYDLVGNKTSQTDAKGVKTQYEYDEINRRILVDYAHSPDITYAYDAPTKGTLSQTVDGLGTTTYQYDQRLRKVQEDRKMDGLNWTTRWSYDALDRVTSQTYPDEQVVAHVYSPQGKLAIIPGIVTELHYNASGRMAQKNYKNNMGTTYTYDDRNNRLTGISSGSGASTVQSLSYTYDNVGNMKTIADGIASKKENFSYDDLDRLVSAGTEDSGYSRQYQYSSVGNMTAMINNGKQTTYSYRTDPSTSPYAVKGMATPLPVVLSLLINSGETPVRNPKVKLNNISSGNPTNFMASEDPSFLNASWQAFSQSADFTLSAAQGVKTVYFKVKNTEGESNVMTSSAVLAPTFTVTPYAGPNGRITPDSPQAVESGATANFTVIPNYGYSISSVTGCAGAVSGNIYTTGPVTADCSVAATFIGIPGVCGPSNGATLTSAPTTGLCNAGTASAVTDNGPWNWTCQGPGGTVPCQANITTWTITSSVTEGNGTISCTSPVNHGLSSICTITPNKGYRLATLTDNDNGAVNQVVGNVYTIPTVTSKHTVVANFVTRGTVIFWRNVCSGENTVWYMEGATHAATAAIEPLTGAWRMVATADLNSNGETDILWRNFASGAISVWYMNGATHASSADLPAENDLNWRIVGAADFNGDGKADILWRNISTGANRVWYMNGITRTGTDDLTPVPDNNWKMVAADFNGDGKPDILWRNSATGQNVIWYMDGINRTGLPVLLEALTDVNWALVGTVDLNKDGKPDILWRNTATGGNMIWYMNGTTHTGTANLDTVTDQYREMAGQGSYSPPPLCPGPWIVTPSAGPNGTISPNTPQTVTNGAKVSFTIIPDAGYSAVVGGTCVGSPLGVTTGMGGFLYITPPITANCTLAVTFAVPPIITRQGARSNTPTSEWLDADFHTSGLDVTYYFQYGETGSYGSTTATHNAGPSTGGVSQLVPGLFPGSLYHYRFVISNSAGTTYGNDMTFTTLPPQIVNGVCDPSAQGGTFTSAPTSLCIKGTPSTVTTNAATYTWTCSGSSGGTNASCSATRAYIVTPSAGSGGAITPNTQQIVSYGSNKQFTVTPNSGYTATVGGTCGGSPTTGASSFPFATNPVTANCTVTVTFTGPPIITRQGARSNTPTSEWLDADFHTNGLNVTYYFQYGPTTSYGSTTTVMNGGPSAGGVSSLTSGLSPGTLYHYRFVISSSAGTTYGNDMTFTTVPLGGATIFWRNTSSGENSLWHMDGSTHKGSVSLDPFPCPGRMVATADFNNDGEQDILWRNFSSGAISVWYMNGGAYAGSADLPVESDLNWRIVGTADFNGDGKLDIVWRNSSTGDDRVWYMNGITRIGSADLPLVADQAWRIAGAADFNHDAKPDLLWRNSATGQNVIWYMDGITRTGFAILDPLPDLTWTLVGTIDLNKDGKPDILWRNTATGANMVWYLDGVTHTGTALLDPVTDQNMEMAGQGNYSAPPLCPKTWTVTPSAGSGGSISPDIPQQVAYGSTASFTITPNPAYTAVVEGTCGGSPSKGTAPFTYTTNPITANCTVAVMFTMPPTIVRVAALDETPTSEMLEAYFDSNGLNPTHHFEYGETTAYGATSVNWTTNAGTGAIGVIINGLFPGTLYHYRFVISNSAGTTYGNDMTFTTLPPQIVNGVCDRSAQGGTFTSAPTSLCSAGTPSTVTTNAATYTWTCSGSSGGTNANCSATRAYIVTPSAGSGGAITPNTQQIVSYGSNKQFTVTPNSGYTATAGGTCGGSPSSGTTQFTYTTNAITANCTVAVTFTAPNYTLTVTKSGSGTVTSVPSGISCGSACSANFNTGTQVTLTATPDASSTFTGWSGEGCSGTGTCTVTMSAARNVTATFTAPLCTLPIFWRNVVTGENMAWCMNGAAHTTTTLDPLPCPWRMVATADFNSDGHTDILWRNFSTGANMVWYLDGATRLGSADLSVESDLNWRIVGVADFNRDGKPDIVWRNISTGGNRVWYMNGITRTGSDDLPPVADQNWRIAGAADFNHDAKPDLLWRNIATGQNVVWYMDGITRIGFAILDPLPDVTWTLVGTIELNKDGNPDLLWRNTSTGANMVWYLDGVTHTGTALLDPVADQNWEIAGQGNYSALPSCSPSLQCANNSQCAQGYYCAKAVGACEAAGVCSFKPQACPMVFIPVCGCDGNTYDNACGAAWAGVTVAHEGQCLGPNVCGSANGGTFTSPPTADLCTAGIPSAVTGNGDPWTWTCQGASKVPCQAYIKKWTVSISPTSSAISPNTPQTANHGSTVTFTITSGSASVGGTCGGSPSSGAGPFIYTTDPVTTDCSVVVSFIFCDSGVCGSANGGTFPSAPTTNLCSVGTPSAVTGSGPWVWTCQAPCGTAQCQAYSSPTRTVNGSVTGGNGTISCTSPVSQGLSSTCTITPSKGYRITTLTDNGSDVLAQVIGNVYTIASVTDNHTVVASFVASGPTIFWRNISTGENTIWYMNGSIRTATATLEHLNGPWRMLATADFNGDGEQDILWRNFSSGAHIVWYMDGTTHAGSADLPPESDLNWRIAGVADFNSDGKADILWRNISTGENRVWYMNGTTHTGSANLTTVTDQNWRIVGTADLNSDGNPDILWRNTTTGQNVVWYMDGITRTGMAFLESLADQNWTLVGATDLNNDKRADILWRNTTTGANMVWYMNGIASTSSILDALADQKWKMAGQGNYSVVIPGDLNRDGIVDIFDYSILYDNYGSTDCGNIADIDGNCVVNSLDYDIMLSNFGKTN